MLKPYSANLAQASKIVEASPAPTPRSVAPARKRSRCGVHLGLDLLAHGAAEEVGLGERVAGERPGDLLHLLLVGDDAVGRREDRLEHAGGGIRPARGRPCGRSRSGCWPSGPAGRARRARSGPRSGRAACRPAPAACRPIPPGTRRPRRRAASISKVFSSSIGMSARSNCVPLRLIIFAAMSSVVSVLRPRKSNFTRPAGSTHFSEYCVTGMSERGSRYIGTSSVQRPLADHDAGGVGRGVAVEPLELHRDLDELGDRLVGVAQLLELRLDLERLRQRHRVGRVGRHQLGQAVDLAVGHLQHAADVAQHGAGLQRSEGDDLGDVVARRTSAGRSR